MRTFLFACCSLAVFAGSVHAQLEPTPNQRREFMVREAIIAEGVKNERVLDSMRKTPRHEFVPEDQQRLAYFDMALPIGEGQTISPPYIVAFMTEKLDPRAEDRVLEIGTGSGYQAAVLSPLVKEVYTIEIVRPLGERAAEALKRLGYKNVHVKVGDGYKGWPEKAPFDKIIVTCSPEKIPKPLVEQLKDGGRMIIPLGERYQQTMYLFRKKDGDLKREALAPTLFVPMTGTAEAGREIKPDPLNPKLRNPSFEKTLEFGRKPQAWHYQRQLKVESKDAPQGDRFATFANTTRGRGAHALQAFGVDGRRVKTLKISGYVKADGVRVGDAPYQIAAVYVTFFDADRAVAARVRLGDWRGSFDWKEFVEEVEVPDDAREAIVRIGLHGATGEVSFDEVTVEKVQERK